MGSYTALYDACVLRPATLRDVLLSLAAIGSFRARWTEDIHTEWIDGLVHDEGIDREKLLRTRQLMDRAVPDCLVTGYEQIIPSLNLPDKDDHHVLAAAIRGGADVIVTYNLKDFPEEKLRNFNIEAQHPDDFIICVIDLAPGPAYEAIKKHRARLKRPPKNVDEYLADLAKQRLPQTVERLRAVSGLI